MVSFSQDSEVLLEKNSVVGGRLRVQKVLRKTQDLYVRTGFRYRNYSKYFEH